MRLILAMMVALAMTSVAWAAESFDDPKALVAAIYDDYKLGQTVADPTVYYSKRLKAIFD